MTRGDERVNAVLLILFILTFAHDAFAWGPAGHAIVTRAALAASDVLPAWFRSAGDALVELSNAPDRWREIEERVPALGARRPDHFFDLDEWGDAPLPADRWGFVEIAPRKRLRPASVGFLPFALLEEYGELLSAFRDARAGRAGGREQALAAAGVLAHLAGDAAVPLHVTRHHHGWLGPDREGFTRSGEVHRWFESVLVESVDPADIRAEAPARQDLDDVPRAVRSMLDDSLAAVPRLYRLERDGRQTRDDGPARALVRERLSAGATFLARLWRTAWVRSG